MLVVDIETTGIDNRYHGIVSIGAVDFIDPDRQFYGECFLRNGAHIMDDALHINGFTYEEINNPNKLSEEELLDEFRAWFRKAQNHTLAGQNPHFDLSFLRETSRRYSMDFNLAHRIIDLHSVATSHMIRKGFPPPTQNRRSNVNSDTIMNYVGIPVEPRPHTAINGAIWEAEAFHRLFYDEPLFDAFENMLIPWMHKLFTFQE